MSSFRVNLPLYIFEERYKRMIRDCIAKQESRIVIVLNPSEALHDGVPNMHQVGAYVDILQIAENADGTFNVLGHKDRCKLQEIDSHSHPYYSVVCEKLPS
ncbi:MAG: LON peptidase substrate-binding domain-containing protein [Deinococcales bacterium]